MYTLTQFKHTFCTMLLEAHFCLPGTALKGRVQSVLTAAACNPLQQGGQGCTIPVEEQYVLHAHVHLCTVINKQRLEKNIYIARTLT